MGQPSIAFRVMLAPLVFVLGMVLLGRYALSIVAPEPQATPVRPPKPVPTPAPRGPDPRLVRELTEGPDRAGAARGLYGGGFADPAWLPAIEAGMERSTSYDRAALQCLRLAIPHSQQLPLVREILLRGLSPLSDDARTEARCALKALPRIQSEARAPLVGLVLAFVDTQPWSVDEASEALAGLRVEPLPEQVLRRLNSLVKNERLDGVKLALSLGGGEFAPDLLRLASEGIWPYVRGALRSRPDAGAVRFLARLALSRPEDEDMMSTLLERDAYPGDASGTVAGLALDEEETEQIRTGAIEFLAFRGKQGVCLRIERLRQSSSEAIRAYATAALMEPRCRP